jgi:phosphonoacetaldehyde hydrolase
LYTFLNQIPFQVTRFSFGAVGAQVANRDPNGVRFATASTVRDVYLLIASMNDKQSGSDKQIRAAVFDWAGTMVDYGSRAPAIVFQEIFRREGVPISPAQAREPMGMAKRAHIAAITRMPDVDGRWQGKFGKPADDDDIDRMYEKFLPLQKDVLADHGDLIPGAVDTFQWCLEHNIRVGSSTGYTQELMQVVVPVANQAGYKPEVVLCAEDAPEGRPAPWLIYECMKRFGVYPASQVVKIDDTTVGIEAGINAGTWTVGITQTGNLVGLSEDEFTSLDKEEQDQLISAAEIKMKDAGAHFVIAGIGDLPPIVETINSMLAEGQKPV